MTPVWDDDDDGDDATMPCPYCRRAIHDDAVRCPYCENYLSEEDAQPARRPWWIIVAVGICLLIVAMWVLGR